MALGGVATGNMNANEAQMVQGSITYRGCSLIAVACWEVERNTPSQSTHLDICMRETDRERECVCVCKCARMHTCVIACVRSFVHECACVCLCVWLP